MKKLEGLLLSCSYYIEGEKPIIQLFFLRENGKWFEVKDDKFLPYLLAEVENFEEVRKEVKNLKIEEKNKQHYVVRCESVLKQRELDKKTVMKINVNRPSSVPALRDKIRKIKGVKRIYEYDIPFAFRYLLDKKLRPLERYYLEVEERKEGLFLKKSVRKESGATTQNIPNGIGIDIETYVSDIGNIIPEKDPILMIALFGENIKKVLIAKKREKKDEWREEKEENYEWIEWCSSEKELLNRFFEIIKKAQPGMIFGYNSDSFDMNYIVKRSSILGIRKEEMIDMKEYFEMMPVVKIKGCPHIDLFKFIRMAGGRGLNLENYTLEEVAHTLLGKEKIALNPLELSEKWDENDERMIVEYAKYNLRDAELTFELANQFFPSIRELTRLIGLPPEETSRMSFSQLVEWYLVRKAVENNILIPARPEKKVADERRRKRFEGAFVFQPTPGIYERIMVFDFRSLYPSIIASHNISPETFRRERGEDYKKEEGYAIPEQEGWFLKHPQGLISSSIKEILKQRKRIKEKLKKGEFKQEEKELLRAREQGLKTLANSVYGYLAYERARWYCYECARAVTSFARYYIKSVIKRAESQGFHVIYSDTDSVFIALENKSKEECQAFVDEINRELPEEMELEFEGYFTRGIFVYSKSGPKGAKKRYALIDEKGALTIKGFEVIRRNWSELGKRIQLDVLRIILEQGDVKKAIEHVKKEIRRIKERAVNLKELEIKTKITKSIRSYATITPHIAAAKKMIEKGEKVGAGSVVSYIVGKQSKEKPKTISERVLLPEECTREDYDDEYYIQNQVIPAIESIFKTVGIEISEIIREEGEGQKSLLGYYNKKNNKK